jgi:hypothetical protein
LQRFTKNLATNIDASNDDGMIVHLINLTGFSGNTYFEPLPVYNTRLELHCEFKPKFIFAMTGETEIPFEWNQGKLTFTLPSLSQYEGLIIEK